MNIMETKSIINMNSLSEFLSSHKAVKNDDGTSVITHTRIGCKNPTVYGGSYNITSDSEKLLLDLYYKHVFINKQSEYLTEKQLETDGPILVDIDFRYSFDVINRQHSSDHIYDMIQVYLEEIKTMLNFENDVSFPIYILEKPTVNRDATLQLTKDGIHMIIGIKMDRTQQMMLRSKILTSLPDVWDLPITNDWDAVLDEGISKGCVNWQMYGSKKPNHMAYEMTYYYEAKWVNSESDFKLLKQDLKTFNVKKDLCKLSARYRGHILIDMNEKQKEEYNKLLMKNTPAKIKRVNKSRINIVCDVDDINYNNISNETELDNAIANILDSLKTNEFYIKETHNYTQILPDIYYKPGSHLNNRKVAFALKHTDERLFLSWVKLRSKADDFDYSTIPSLYNEWNNFKTKHKSVTKRSIMYWAKQDAYDDYVKVKSNTIDNYIEDTLTNAGDWDYAQVLYHMFKDKYVCTSIKNKTWYVFSKHRWEKDEGQSLRMAISKELFQIYSDKQSQYLTEVQAYPLNNDTIIKQTEIPKAQAVPVNKDEYKTVTDSHERVQLRVKKITEIMVKLKKTNDKNNIMREAMEIFFDKSFSRNMDSNPYLLCFNNGVYDFENKEFRNGYPQDYITKTTGISYNPYNYMTNKVTIDEINTFMNQLFPLPDVCEYMWQHLASTLIGVKKEQVFNIYRGSGSNGKSILTELMSLCLGDYKGTVPITLVTEKRNGIGGTSSEVIQLKGVRYAVMQEPTVGSVINEGILKELTGGDPIQARALYSESEIFTPQFSLVVCTNSLFEIKSNDDGTWRRMKLVDFISKFITQNEEHTDDTRYVYPKDKGLKEKLHIWAQVFISMLIDRVNKTDGEVIDCKEVIAASNKYRQSQDCINGFIVDRIMNDETSSLGVKILNNNFKEWFQMNYGNRKPPKLKELEEAIIKKFGNKGKDNKWRGIRIRPDEEDDDNEPIEF